MNQQAEFVNSTILMTIRGESMNQPTVDEGINKLKLVLSGEMTREEASDWAESYVMCDDPEIDDDMVWDLLMIISGIDILDSPTSYLHSEEDIEEWIKDAINLSL